MSGWPSFVLSINNLQTRVGLETILSHSRPHTPTLSLPDVFPLHQSPSIDLPFQYQIIPRSSSPRSWQRPRLPRCILVCIISHLLPSSSPSPSFIFHL